MSNKPETKHASAPGPWGWPLLGHLPRFLPDKLGFLTRCAKRYGDVVKLKVGTTTYLIINPEDIRHVLETKHSNYVKTPRLTSEPGRRLSGEGLLTSSGSAHQKQRRLLQPYFLPRTVSAFADMMVEATDEVLDLWSSKNEIDIEREMMALSQRIILRALFGQRSAEESDALCDAITVRRRYIQYVFNSPSFLAEYLPFRINREYRRAIKLIDSTIYRAIGERRRLPEPKDDLTSLFINAKYEDGSVMTDKQVRDEVLTLLITGFETLGEAMAWSWYLISQHPEAESRLLLEVSKSLEGRAPEVRDVPGLKYTDMILSESMRLYPPTWMFVRMALNADTLPGGAELPAGSKIYLCPYITHRLERYFPDPDAFVPERFSDEGKRNLPKFAYYPFGGGPRLCIGHSFARLEGVLVLARVAQRFSLRLVSGQRIKPSPGIVLHPREGIRMTATPR